MCSVVLTLLHRNFKLERSGAHQSWSAQRLYATLGTVGLKQLVADGFQIGCARLQHLELARVHYSLYLSTPPWSRPPITVKRRPDQRDLIQRDMTGKSASSGWPQVVWTDSLQQRVISRPNLKPKEVGNCTRTEELLFSVSIAADERSQDTCCWGWWHWL